MIWQVVPFSRMQYAREIVQRFRAQTYAQKKLCLVVNGCGTKEQVEEQFRKLEVQPDLLLHTPEHPELGKPWALNRAMAELSGEVIALRDDDDIQGPGDLAEAMEAYWVTGATIVSKHPHHVLIDEERWLFAEPLANQWARVGDTYDARVSGSNVLFRNRDVPLFPEVHSGEVRQWARTLIGEGATVWRTSTENYTWVRGRHTHRWRATSASIRDDYGRGFPAKRWLPNGEVVEVAPPTMEEIMREIGRWK